MGLIDGRTAIAGIAALALAFGFVDTSRADTIEAALVRAYQNNPQLNAQRASVRATDENVPRALSGYRPRVAITANVGEQYQRSLTTVTRSTVPPTYTRLRGNNAPRAVGATVNQTIFNGFQTANAVRQAESQVSSAREGLRVLEQTVLLSAATIYMDYLRDAAIVEVQRSNVRVLEQTLKQVQRPFQRGRGHPHRRRAIGGAARRRPVATADGQIQPEHDAGEFRRIIGNEPSALAPGTPVDRFFPAAAPIDRDRPDREPERHCGDARHRHQLPLGEGGGRRAVSDRWHRGFGPAILRNLADRAEDVQCLDRCAGDDPRLSGRRGIRADPAEQGNAGAATAGAGPDARSDARHRHPAWGLLQAAKAQIVSAQAQVTASETALNGVREEARVGQRTTLDVLNAQQALVNARVNDRHRPA